MQKITDKELNQFYGVEVAQCERNKAIANSKSSYDADQLWNDSYECFEAINAALGDGDEMKAGFLLQAARQATIARIASRAAYGFNNPTAITVDDAFPETKQKIAAAAQVLEALKRIVDWNTRPLDSGLDAGRGITQIQLEQARAAIAKVEGTA